MAASNGDEDAKWQGPSVALERKHEKHCVKANGKTQILFIFNSVYKYFCFFCNYFFDSSLQGNILENVVLSDMYQC